MLTGSATDGGVCGCGDRSMVFKEVDEDGGQYNFL
jgi:hypothetical protein